MATLCVLMPRYQRFVLPPQADPAPALDRALRGFDGTAIAAADPWRADLMTLLALARSLAPQAGLRVRIETKASNDCPAFHVDQVALRLLCTYRGAGTQWLPDHADADDRCGQDNNDRVREIACGAVAVAKGARYPGQPDRGLMHRSPPTPVQFPRVVVVIDIDFP